MWNRRKILTRLKNLTYRDWFSPGIEKEEKYTRYWEGYRAALKDVLETEDRFILPWEKIKSGDKYEDNPRQ
jgi:hypothetical protein